MTGLSTISLTIVGAANMLVTRCCSIVASTSSGSKVFDSRMTFAAAFAMWERAANISFQAVEHPAVADILIGAQAEPKGRAFTEVIYDRKSVAAALPAGALSPPDTRAMPGAIRRIDKALICLNPDKSWKVGFGGDVEVYDLRYTVAHEIGHIIGARHDLSLDTIMTPFPYGHGYVNGTKWRDIMSYREACGGCPRLPVWSSPLVQVKGEPAGTPAGRPSLDDPDRPKRMERPASPDDLKLISGVGPKIEGILHSLGIFTFAQVASWTGAEREWVDSYLNFKGRIERDQWVRQAEALARGGVAEYVRVFGRNPR